MRLSVGRLLDDAALEDVRPDEGLYVDLWRGGADAWRREQAVRPLTPQALGSHALLVAVHPEGAEVGFGADRLLLTGDGVVLVPTSSSYRLESRGGDLKLLVVVGGRLDESAAPQGTEHAVPVGSDEKAGRHGDKVGQEQPTGEEQQQGQPEVAGEEVDVQAIVAAALARFTAAASPPPTTEALEEEDQRRRSEEAQVAMEQDEEPEFMGTQEAPREVGPQGLGVADNAGPKTGEVETCRHWAKGWCMRADACRFAHPQPPVPRGVPQDLLGARNLCCSGEGENPRTPSDYSCPMPIKGLGILVVQGKGKTKEPPVIICLPRHNRGGGRGREGHPPPQLHPSLISVTHSHRPVTDSHRQSQIVTDSHR